MFVVEQGGRIRVVRGGRVLRRPFLDVSRRDRLAAASRACSASRSRPTTRARAASTSTTRTARGDTRIVEYRAQRGNPDVADAGSARVVLAPGPARAQPQRRPARVRARRPALHRPRRRRRRRRPARRARQRPGPRHAARQDPAHRPAARAAAGRTAIPRDNPFVGPRRRARRRSTRYGLRNPWRFSFDRETGDLVDRRRRPERGRGDRLRRAAAAARGANFGWRPFEGNDADLRRRGRARPRPARSSRRRHDDGYCSITGGYVVRDPALPALRGRYVYGDFCEGTIRARAADAPAAPSDDRALDLAAGRLDLVVRRGRPRPRLRHLARRAGLPAHAGVSARRRTTSRWSGPTTPGRSR